jgi:hypothetical protein
VWKTAAHVNQRGAQKAKEKDLDVANHLGASWGSLVKIGKALLSTARHVARKRLDPGRTSCTDSSD